jgi:ribosomal protein S18 acetylase RimI-like enzyme
MATNRTAADHRLIVRPVPRAETGEAATVLCDAFYDYPVMRYVLGPKPGYDRRLRMLVDFFVSARMFRDEPVLGVEKEAGALAAAAIVSLSGERPAPEELAVRREEVWREIGAAERERYEVFGAACAQFALDAPHLHLNMIGVRRADAGRGLGRKLLEAVHALAHADPQSAGVTLSTESPENVALYEHFGYRVMGHARVSDELETWAFFRPRE